MKTNLSILVGGRVGANCYVLSDEKGRALIFDIPDSCGERVADFCANNNLTPLAILLTHGHFDHCGGVAAFLRRFAVKVYGSEADASLAASATANRYKVKAENCHITDYVTDGQSLGIADFDVKVIATPGHTAGSVCYIVGDDMFSGDTLFHGDIGRTDFPESVPGAMAESLKKLAAINGNYTVYPGHEEATTLEEEKRENPYLR